MIELRPHQLAAVASVYPLKAGDRKLVVVPAGGGKSLIAAQWATDGALLGRVLMLVPTSELAEQNEKALRILSPDLDVGVYCSGLKRYESDNRVVIAVVNSIYKRLELFDDVELIIVDEAHRISPVGGKMYRAVMLAFKRVPVLLLTATPYRMSTGYLHKGEHKICDELSYEVPYDQLVADGYLAPFAESGSDLAYDTSKTRIKAGEFNQSQLDGMVDYPKTRKIVEQALERSKGRKHILCFAINLRHCGIIHQVLTEFGVSSLIVDGDMSRDERRDARYLFELGVVDVAINCNVWGTGYDFPALDCIWLLRPTASVGFFVQMVGRGTRIAEGKSDAAVLDFGGNVSRHGHFSRPEVREKGNGKGQSKNCKACGERNSAMARHCAVCKVKFQEMFKDCPKCTTEVDMMAQTCSACAYGWPVNEAKLDEEGSTMLPNASIWLNVEAWNFRVHEKVGSPYKSLVVSYKTVDHGTVQEYVFPEHPATRVNFVKWWTLHNGQRIPKTAGEAYAQKSTLNRPEKIKVIRSGKFHVFLGRTFGANHATGHKPAARAFNGRSQQTVQTDSKVAARDDALLNNQII